MPPEIWTQAGQIGFIALVFIWLLKDVRAESKSLLKDCQEREAKSHEREVQTTMVLQKYADQLPALVEAIKDLGNRIDILERK